jgi:hypothetical protein
MTTTIHIRNDKDESIVEKSECNCLFTHGGVPHATCSACNGTGIVTFSSSQWELNMSNRNFSSLWHALGYEFDYSGEIHPFKLYNDLQTLQPQLVTRSPFSSHNIYEYGLDAERVQFYIDKLLSICQEAMKREENLCWG